MRIEKVGVIGCGLMGAGIAEVAARSGHETVVREVSQEFLDRGMDKISRSLGKAVDRGKLPAEDRDATLGRLTGTTELSDMADCDLVVEAIVENLDEKCRTFVALDEVASEERDLREQHLVPHDHRDRHGDEPAGAFRGSPLLQPGAGDELVEVVRTTGRTRPSSPRPVRSPRDRQGARGCRGQFGLRRESPPGPYLVDSIRASTAASPPRRTSTRR